MTRTTQSLFFDPANRLSNAERPLVHILPIYRRSSRRPAIVLHPSRTWIEVGDYVWLTDSEAETVYRFHGHIQSVEWMEYNWIICKAEGTRKAEYGLWVPDTLLIAIYRDFMRLSFLNAITYASSLNTLSTYTYDLMRTQSFASSSIPAYFPARLASLSPSITSTL